MPLIVFLLAAAVFAQGTSEFMLAGLLPAIAADLDIAVPQAALLTSTFAVGMIVGAPLMAALSRRWPPRRALSVFLLCFIVMHIVGALTDSYAVLLVTRVVAAIANAGFLAVTLSTISALVRPERTTRAVAIILAGTTLALVAGVPTGALVGSVLGWRAALWGVALLSVPALLAVAVAVPVRTDTVLPIGGIGGEVAVLQHRSLRVPLALAALVNGATFCAFTYLAPIVTERANLDPSTVPIVLAVFGIGSFLGVWAAGRFGDAHAPRILTIGGGGLLAGWVVFAVSAQYPALVFVLALVQGGLSFAVGSTLIALSIRAASGAPTMSGAFATASVNGGAAAGPVLGGIAYGTSVGTTGPLIVSAGLIAAALMVRRVLA
ncbi:Cmx/CmrA family chloramphenicol efflux MFS transporter [Rhodococcus sp. H29-C3]|uniref:Cmx/CmrA family chloramphenicol efflux MFS transporter n=1 Tax=Rhodococcus sp. H29-C3 TaxID=3046307 RepID=UPI0024B88202|nr:Cmx/CmrA family chloramphenicol efflux MFS transporter [Rhodococcus sp. H29-C3]MDJ0363471.1 MFS transporter [Rhodococcus sp. H29-C3]